MIFLKKIISVFLYIWFICNFNYNYGFAQELNNQTELNTITQGRITKLPLPRFVTLRNNKTNMRSGPGKEYALLWVYQKKGLPVQIIDEYDQWRRIKDLDGSEGWIHQSVLSGRRMLITLEGTHNVYDDSDLKSDIIAKIDGGILLKPSQCTDYYCFVIHDKFSGWIEKNVLYGIDDTEKLNE